MMRLVLVLVLLLPVLALGQDLEAASRQLFAIAAKAPGKFGFAAIHVETGKILGVDEQARYPMGSVYKALIGLTVLDLVDRGKEQLSRRIELQAQDMVVGHSPIREAFKPGQTFSVEELLQRMVSNSDNTACDVLLREIGGPVVVTNRLRAWGFRNVQVDRTERQIAVDLGKLDEAALERYWAGPGDTSTPMEMARVMSRIARCDLVKPAACALLKRWMYETPTSSKRIKGLLPQPVRVEHKTGGMPGVVNDVGIITLPNGKGHLAVAALMKAVTDVDAAEGPIAQATLVAYLLFNQ